MKGWRIFGGDDPAAWSYQESGACVLGNAYSTADAADIVLSILE